METGISRRNQDVTVPTRVLNMLNMCMHVSSIRRNRAQTAQPTHLVDRLTCGRRFLVESMFARKVYRAHCVTKRHIPCISLKRRNSGYVGNVDATSRTRELWYYAQSTTLAVEEHPRCTASMIRWACSEVTPCRPAQGKPRRNHRHLDATSVDRPY